MKKHKGAGILNATGRVISKRVNSESESELNSAEAKKLKDLEKRWKDGTIDDIQRREMRDLILKSKGLSESHEGEYGERIVIRDKNGRVVSLISTGAVGDETGPLDILDLVNSLRKGLFKGLIRMAADAEKKAGKKIAKEGVEKLNNIVIQFGKEKNQIDHAFRHTDALGLDRNVVQSAVQNHFKKVSSQIVEGKPFNQIIEVGGQRIQYTAFKLVDGTINIGRIHGIK